MHMYLLDVNSLATISLTSYGVNDIVSLDHRLDHILHYFLMQGGILYIISKQSFNTLQYKLHARLRPQAPAPS